ncbi:MAG TPA: exodeoxyribonuclease III [Hyphomicrobiaceae bacterium]|nr:exodeoxyribonuclease III [Hyphomicrobiaceae bacterium]
MKIATWNINGVKARLDQLTRWLDAAQPDLVCLQEIKCADDAFPTLEFNGRGYSVAVCGQKGFNGVAILSRFRLEEVVRNLPGDDTDTHARYVEAVVSFKSGVLRIASIYLPNGNPIGSDKFAYKLRWMQRLERRMLDLLGTEEPLVLAGDYNVIPEPLDAKKPEDWITDALYQPESRAAWRRCINLGLTDALRACHPGPGPYTFWDYQAGAWQKDHGIRIDHILLSPEAADRLRMAHVDRATRGWEKPSDHAPVWIDLDLGP